MFLKDHWGPIAAILLRLLASEVEASQIRSKNICGHISTINRAQEIRTWYRDAWTKPFPDQNDFSFRILRHLLNPKDDPDLPLWDVGATSPIPVDGFPESSKLSAIHSTETHVLDLGTMATIDRILYDFPNAKHYHFSDFLEFGSQRRRTDVIDAFLARLVTLVPPKGSIEILDRGFLDFVSPEAMNELNMRPEPGGDFKRLLEAMGREGDPIIHTALKKINLASKWTPDFALYIPKILSEMPELPARPITVRIASRKFGEKFFHYHIVDFNSPSQVSVMLRTIPKGMLAGVLINSATIYPAQAALAKVARKLREGDGWFIRSDNMWPKDEGERMRMRLLFNVEEFDEETPHTSDHAKVFLGKAI